MALRCYAIAAACGLAAAACEPAPMDSFPVNLMGFQIFGLGQSNGGSMDDCAAKCCNDTNCNVFSYCPANSEACGKQSPDSSCMTGNNANQGNCSTGGGAIWCNWYSFARADKGITSPYPDCNVYNPPTSPTMAVPPRLPTGVPGATGRAGDGWGVNFHANEWSGRTSEFDMAAAAFRVVRLDLSWGSVENKAGGCGTYNFSAYDAADAAWRARGVQPLYVLDYWSDCYDGGSGCSTPACADAYGSFGAAAMAHFPGAIHECQNEPQGPPFYPNSNATLLSAMCYSVRAKAAAAGKLSYWTGPTTSWFDYNWIVDTLEQCIFNAFHAWSIHPYTDGTPESRLGDMAELANFIYLAGRPTVSAPFQVLSSEWGYTSCEPGQCTDPTNIVHMEQGKYLARMMLSQTMFGAPYSIWYDFKDDPYNPTDTESHFGAINGTLLPADAPTPYAAKPGYLAALALQTGVGNGTFAGRLNATISNWDASADDVFVLQFNGASAGKAKDYPAFAVWTNISMCLAEGPRYACPGTAPAPDLYACLAAGCCYNEGAPAGEPRCYAYPYADEPLQAAVAVPPPAAADACWDVVDVWGHARGTACAVAGVLTANVTDGPTYFL